MFYIVADERMEFEQVWLLNWDSLILTTVQPYAEVSFLTLIK